ncbi:MAG TPA: Mur ligase family protein, partial [Isosphaeraceae bacterium]|nr:Mur ligase family protein [Isosphaeraceae bacterium]
MARWFLDHSAHRGIPSVSLRQLLPDAWFPGRGDLLVSGCSSNALRLEPGEVFVAVESIDHDGHNDVELALERGAAAVVVERPSPEAGRLQVVVPDTRKALGALAHALAGEPSESLSLSAFCGTTGAEAASTFLRSILEASGQRVGMIGSHEWTDGHSVYPLRTSELSPPELASLLGRMIDRRCASALLCVTRKGVEDGSAESLLPAEAVVLNVHAPGMDADEAQRTRRVFSKLTRSVVPTGTVIVNADDPDAELLGGVHLDARRIAFSLKGNGEVSGRIDRLDSQGSRLTLSGFGDDFAVELRPAGHLAVEAALAAAAVAWSRGIDRGSVRLGLEAVTQLKGRLEPLPIRDGVDVRLEYP